MTSHVRKATPKDEQLLLDACHAIDPDFNGYGHLLEWSWIFEYPKGFGFIEMIPFRIIDPFASFDIANIVRGEHGGYFHAAALYLSRPTNLRILLAKFYAQYPFTFPHIMTLTPATAPGLNLDYRLGFHPSAFHKIWYKTHNTYDDLPLLKPRLRERLILQTPPD